MCAQAAELKVKQQSKGQRVQGKESATKKQAEPAAIHSSSPTKYMGRRVRTQPLAHQQLQHLAGRQTSCTHALTSRLLPSLHPACCLSRRPHSSGRASPLRGSSSLTATWPLSKPGPRADAPACRCRRSKAPRPQRRAAQVRHRHAARAHRQPSPPPSPPSRRLCVSPCHQRACACQAVLEHTAKTAAASLR